MAPRVMVLAAGYGTRFLPVTEKIPKALFPFLNVPLIRSHLASLARHGILEAGVNLHHLGEKIEGHLRDGAADLPKLRLFPEAEILGTAGALRNAAGWLSDGDFLVVNTDTVIEPDIPALLARHRETGRAATLLVAGNRNPDRYTPLQAEGDRITGFGVPVSRPLLYTGVCVLSPRLLHRIQKGHAALVADLWAPLLRETREEIGWLLHPGPFADLGRPSDFLRASLEALNRGGPFPVGGGSFDAGRRVLFRERPGNYEVSRSVLGRAEVGARARIADSAVWDGVEVGAGAFIRGCLAAGGRVLSGARHDGVLLWPGEDGLAAEHPLS
jgi:mannose-1-phosphate guanylyltransferase/phosphomannomutase